MPATMRRAIALVWLVIPPLAFSALIHSTDVDVEAVQGFWPPSILLSVVVWGLPVIAVALLCLEAAIRRGWGVAAVVGAGLAAAVAVPLAILQTPRAHGVAGIARPALGGTALVWVFLAVAVVPAAMLGWPGRSHRPEPPA